MTQISKKSALQVSQTLDRIASVFEANFEALGIPEKIATDFAFRCDLLSDAVEKQADVFKKALDDLDPVLEPGFNPDDVGREVGGPLEGDADEAFMQGEFSRQENRELRDLQESGAVSEVNEEPRPPQAGRQANLDDALSRLSKEAGEVHEIGSLRDSLKICAAKLSASGVSEVKSLAGAADKLVAALDKIRDAMISMEASGEANLGVMAAADRSCNAIGEVLPFLEGLCNSLSAQDSDSPVQQLQMQSMLEGSSSKLEKLVGLAAKIVSSAMSEMGGSDKGAE